MLNGYVYRERELGHRRARSRAAAELFATRGGHYYRHWDELYERWVEKVEETTRELEAARRAGAARARGRGGRHRGSWRRLEPRAPRRVRRPARGSRPHHAVPLRAQQPRVRGLLRLLRALPAGIPGHLGPDDRAGWSRASTFSSCARTRSCKRLARLALELGVAEAVEERSDEEALRAGARRDLEAGARWLADFDETKNPWFYFSNGNGLYHHHRSWIDDTSAADRRHRCVHRDDSRQARTSRARTTRCSLSASESPPSTASLLADDVRPPFDESLALARTVYPFIENHNFYIEHRYLTLFWNKVREFGALLVRPRIPSRRRRTSSTCDTTRCARRSTSSVCTGARAAPEPLAAHDYWPPIVERRKSIYESMREWAPPPALGRVPETITDPIAVMLWGITDERIQEWLVVPGRRRRSQADRVSRARPGVAEGAARVILRPEQLGELEQGEILVAASTSPELDTGLRHGSRPRCSTPAASCATRPSSPASTGCRR